MTSSRHTIAALDQLERVLSRAQDDIEALLRRVSELRRRGVASARVITAVGNVAAIRAYELGGFHRHGFDQVHRDVTQQVLVWP